MTHDPREEDSLRTYRLIAICALAVIVVAVPLSLVRRPATPPIPTGDAPTFVGRTACASCHEKELRAFEGSDHDNAMAEATEETVLGDFGDASFSAHGVVSRFYRREGRFYVTTEGPDGTLAEFEVAYTFGVRPLQQYLVRFPGGRLQALHLAWDVGGRRWFHLYPQEKIQPGDWMHWTRNAMNWNGMCAECHSTNLVKGFIPESGTYETTWSEIDVSCEACHGPASRHVAWARESAMARPQIPNAGLAVRTREITALQMADLCAPCHSRRSEVADYRHDEKALLDAVVPTVLTEGLYFPDGQIQDEVYEYGSFAQSKMLRHGVRCSDCHDVHSLEPHAAGNTLCTRCHQAEVYDAPSHHFHDKPGKGDSCVGCHMPERVYMGIDRRRDHSIRVPRPDLSASLGVPSACAQSGCHADKPIRYLLDAQSRWYGQSRKPHYGEILAAGRTGDRGAKSGLVRLASDALQAPVVRATALALLARYPSAETTESFLRALNDEDPLTRQTAAISLPALTAEEAVARLAPLLFDPVRGVRLAALPALAGLPDPLFKPYQLERRASVLAEYEESQRRNLDFAASGLNLGNLYERLGRRADAERHFRLALAVDELFHPAKVNLAMLLNATGRNAEAERLLREVLASDPSLHEIEYSLGLLLAEEKRLEEAAALLDRAASFLPRHGRARYNLGLLLDTLGRSAEALRALEAAVALEPENAEFTHALAWHHLKEGNREKARPLVERLERLAPGSDSARQMRQLLARREASASR